MAAVADFNSGNMLLTSKLSVFTAGMTLLLNHLKHPVIATVRETHVKIWTMSLHSACIHGYFNIAVKGEKNNMHWERDIITVCSNQ